MQRLRPVTSLKTIPPAGSSPTTPRALLGLWRAALEDQDRSAGTVRKYTQAVSAFLAWYEQQERSPLTLDALTPIALIGYRNELQHEQQKSVSTINLHVSALRTWCAWLLDAGYLVTDPSLRVKLVSGAAASEREGLSGSQLRALLRAAQSSRDPLRNYAVLQILLQTGLRLSECSGLTFGDVTFGERGGTLLVRAGKGNKVRSVLLNSSARDTLATYVAPRLDVGKVSLRAVANAWPKPKSPRAFQPLWLSQKGGVLTASAMGQRISDLVNAAGDLVPEETSAHALRHTFALSYLAQYLGDLVGLATLLGHSSLDTTRLYSQPAVSQLAIRLERLALNAFSG